MIDFTSRRPRPNVTVEAHTQVAEVLDRFILSNKQIYSAWPVVRPVCRLYIIYTSNSRDFHLKTATGFVIKLAGVKFIISALEPLLGDYESTKGRELLQGCIKVPLKKNKSILRPVALASFGNIDLERHIRSILDEGVGYDKETKAWNHQQLVEHITDRFS